MLATAARPGRGLLLLASGLAAAGGFLLVHLGRQALLNRIMPGLVARLSTLLGRPVQVQAATLDNRYHLVLSGVVIPLTRDLGRGSEPFVHLERLEIAALPAFFSAGARRWAAVVGFVGTLESPGGERFGPKLKVPFRYTRREPTGENPGGLLQIQGAVASTATGLASDAETIPFDLDAELTSSVEECRVDGLALRVGAAGMVTGQLRVSTAMAVSGNIQISQVEMGTLLRVASMVSGGPVPPATPRETEAPPAIPVNGTLELDGRETGRLELKGNAGESRLVVSCRFQDGRFDASGRVAGRLALAQVARICPAQWRVGVQGDSTVEFDLPLTGTLVEPVLSGLIEVGPTAQVSLGDLGVELGAATVQVRLSRSGLEWRDLKLALLAGELRGSGQLGRSTARGGWAHRLDMNWAGLKLAGVRLPSGSLAEIVEGTVAGNLTISGIWCATPELAGSGSLTVGEPRFGFLKTLVPVLARYGLPALATEGTEPLSCTLVVGPEGLTLTDIAVKMPDASVSGQLKILPAGGLGGALAVSLRPEYLGQSSLLSLPARLAGNVTVPFNLGGTLGRPQIAVPLADALGALLRQSGLSGALSGLLGNLMKKPARPPEDDGENSTKS